MLIFFFIYLAANISFKLDDDDDDEDDPGNKSDQSFKTSPIRDAFSDGLVIILNIN